MSTNPNHTVRPSIPHPADPPLTAADADLLTHFIACNYNIHALAEQSGLPLLRLLDWAFSAPVQARMNAMMALAEQALEIKATEARITALDTLDELAAHAKDPAERQRAAAALARATPRQRTPRPAKPARSAPETAAPTDTFAFPTATPAIDDHAREPAPNEAACFVDLTSADLPRLSDALAGSPWSAGRSDPAGSDAPDNLTLDAPGELELDNAGTADDGSHVFTAHIPWPSDRAASLLRTLSQRLAAADISHRVECYHAGTLALHLTHNWPPPPQPDPRP